MEPRPSGRSASRCDDLRAVMDRELERRRPLLDAAVEIGTVTLMAIYDNRGRVKRFVFRTESAGDLQERREG